MTRADLLASVWRELNEPESFLVSDDVSESIRQFPYSHEYKWLENSDDLNRALAFCLARECLRDDSKLAAVITQKLSEGLDVRWNGLVVATCLWMLEAEVYKWYGEYLPIATDYGGVEVDDLIFLRDGLFREVAATGHATRKGDYRAKRGVKSIPQNFLPYIIADCKLSEWMNSRAPDKGDLHDLLYDRSKEELLNIRSISDEDWHFLETIESIRDDRLPVWAKQLKTQYFSSNWLFSFDVITIRDMLHPLMACALVRNPDRFAQTFREMIITPDFTSSAANFLLFVFRDFSEGDLKRKFPLLDTKAIVTSERKDPPYHLIDEKVRTLVNQKLTEK